jgi:methylaspartate ammonia-lyase
MEEVKQQMVFDYGAIMTYGESEPVCCKYPIGIDVSEIYPYAKWISERTETGKNGKKVQFNCYVMFKRTHELDTKEMSRLIEGTVFEAKELDIQTETPEQIAKMLNLWEYDSFRTIPG